MSIQVNGNALYTDRLCITGSLQKLEDGGTVSDSAVLFFSVMDVFPDRLMGIMVAMIIQALIRQKLKQKKWDGPFI